MQYEIEKIKRRQLSKRIKRRRALDYFFLFMLIFLVVLLVMVLLPVAIRIVTDSNA